MRTVAVMAIMVAMLGACGSKGDDSSSTAAAGDEVMATASGQVALQVGQTLVVTLPSNPSTGYSWAITTAPDSTVLTQTGDLTYAATNPDVVMPGSGGTETVRFTASSAGSTTVVLDYRRPWETDVPPVDTVTLVVTVTG